MATAEYQDCVQQIGTVAGLVWKTLYEEQPMSIAKLARTVEAPRDIVMQAVGWLAREGKVDITDTSRGRVIRLNGE